MRQFSLAGLRLPWGPGAPESLHGGPCEGVSVAPAVPFSLIPAWRGERCPEQGCALWIFIPCLPGMGTSSSIHQCPESPRAGGSQLASHDHTRIHSHKHMCTHMHTYVHTHTHPQAHTHTHSPGVPAGEQPALLQTPGPCILGPAPQPRSRPSPKVEDQAGLPPTLRCPHRSSPSDAVTVTPGQSLTGRCQTILLTGGGGGETEAQRG